LYLHLDALAQAGVDVVDVHELVDRVHLRLEAVRDHLYRDDVARKDLVSSPLRVTTASIYLLLRCAVRDYL
jgi:hypothetical protein